MVDQGIPLNSEETLEDWLIKNNDKSFFPKIQVENNEKPYYVRYEELKNKLNPIHDRVEKGAMSNEVNKWLETIKNEILRSENEKDRIQLLFQLNQSDPIVYLNNHGRGHVSQVINKVSEILQFFNQGYLTPYEGFLLLCAIQAHDIGNYFGRKDHEKSSARIFDEISKDIIPDSIERNIIERLAMAHCGEFNNHRYKSKDTIDQLAETRPFYGRNVREKLLAALLRFGDELADDITRADKIGIESGNIPDSSQIYHYYSQSLHTVKVHKNNEINCYQLELSYEFDINIATKLFIKNNSNKLLLDEIYDRTLKIERERRYCFRFIRPNFSLDRIKVEILISNAKEKFDPPFKILYNLEEKGYPSDPISGKIIDIIPEIRSGEEINKELINKWGLL